MVECPDPEWAAQVLSLLGHKGPEWRHHIEAALQEPLDDLQTLFYLGLVEGTAITNVMIAGARRGAARCGILGHVYTRPEHRRKGAYAHLMARPDGARPPPRLPRAHPGDGLRDPALLDLPPLRLPQHRRRQRADAWLATPDAEAGWFRPGETSVRPMRWDDWAPLNLLAYQPTTPDEELPRSLVFRLPGHGSLEGSFLRVQLPLPEHQSPRTAEALRRAWRRPGWRR